ncbi:UNVERIFIED_CONTAM: hypothetical protein PYX00_010651 [Menopon gallinae]|uniref:PDZ domain-containing protein n=1 Tax=Menopon gallinae TaxID=328185 RepID=A0AAW2HGI8_9NEOP
MRRPRRFGCALRDGSRVPVPSRRLRHELIVSSLLQVGDQIIRINGLSVEDATHQEVLQLAQTHHQLTLTVKSVGLIPVKDKSEDPLTWKVVENGGCVEDQPLTTVGSDIDRIRIEIPENCQLGCGICKGPDWRPGIFIQYTKPNSLARKCGLQPGDQILQCNRISFLQIDFSYAVSVLKNTRVLDLVLKKGSGIDLFPGESSGYSSSSSIADEAVNQPTSKTKRLSIVAEESDDRYHRKTCHCKHPRNGTLKSSGSIDSVFDCVPDGDGSRYRERSKSIEILTDANFKKTVTFKNHENVTRTLLNIKPRDSCHHCLVGNQTVIKIESNDVGRDIPAAPSMSVEKKIGESLISVEVHRSNEKCSSEKSAIEKSPSSSSFSSGSSLSSAISREIQRRNERKLKGAPAVRQERPELKPPNRQNRHQHDLLIAELKKKQGIEEKTSNVSTQTDADKATSTNVSTLLDYATRPACAHGRLRLSRFESFTRFGQRIFPKSCFAPRLVFMQKSRFIVSN